MTRYLLRRVGAMVLALFFIVSLTFMMMKAVPGGPFAREKKLPAAIIKNLETKYHLDDPILVQYEDYLLRTARLDFGPSFKYQNRSVNEIIWDGFPVSAQLGFLSVLIALFFGLFLGIISALRQNRFQDHLAMIIATIGFSIPSFVTGFGLMYLFAFKLRLFPAAMWGSWRHMVLPAVALALLPLAAIARLMRSSLIEVLQQDYIRTAKSKGLRERTVILRHGLRNAIMPVLTYLGPLIAGVFTGSFIVEYIFNIPGLGRYFVVSIQNRDYTVIMGTTVFYSIFLMLMNLAVDVLYALVDPRVKLTDEKR